MQKITPIQAGLKDLPVLAALAKEIWEEHFTPILGKEQVSYMLEKFQSHAAMQRQIEQEGYQYYILQDTNGPFGYLAIAVQDDSLFLSKIYIRRDRRGNGFASQAIAFLKALCQRDGLTNIWLTVNRNNTNSIAIYKKLGFSVLRTQKTDIGSGFFMDDYVMQLPVL